MSLPPNEELIRCQICSHSNFFLNKRVQFPRDQLYAHIAQHINYPHNSEYHQNPRLHHMCEEEVKHCILVEQLTSEGNNRQRRNFLTLSSPAPCSFSPNTNAPSSSNDELMPSMTRSNSPSISTFNGERSTGQREETPSKMEEVLSSDSSETKLDVHQNDNEAESVLFYTNLRRMSMEEEQNVTDCREIDSVEESGAKEKRTGQRKRTTENHTTNGGQRKKTRSCSTGGRKGTGTSKELTALLNDAQCNQRNCFDTCSRSKKIASSASAKTPKRTRTSPRKTHSAGEGRQSQPTTPNRRAFQRQGKQTKGRKGKDNRRTPLKTTSTAVQRQNNSNKCICGQSVESSNGRFLVGCSECRKWFHGSCFQIKFKQSKRIPHWLCLECQKKQKEKEESRTAEDDIQEMHCVCGMPDDGTKYVCCDGCNRWMHPKCVGRTQKDIDALGKAPFACPECQKKPTKFFEDKMKVIGKMEPEN